jgi:hypothetical protein
MFQELRDAGELTRVELSMDDVLSCRHASEGRLCAVSHRWEDPNEPDGDGVQLEAMRGYLQQHPHIELVWYDWCCMPQSAQQRKRTLAERAQFRFMLENVNRLYLGLHVLILFDLSYPSRFWTQVPRYGHPLRPQLHRGRRHCSTACMPRTCRPSQLFSSLLTPPLWQFEMWLSMQVATRFGLVPAKSEGRRCHICPIHNAGDLEREALIKMWEHRTPHEAYALLASRDVSVTNESDKEGQLKKLLKLNDDVQESFRDDPNLGV